jgi:ADP-ribose pyrophosphatase YjhB (NUDIX family)
MATLTSLENCQIRVNSPGEDVLGWDDATGLNPFEAECLISHTNRDLFKSAVGEITPEGSRSALYDHIAQLDDDECVVGLQYSTAPKNQDWFTAGDIQLGLSKAICQGETPEECAARCLFEEVGWVLPLEQIRSANQVRRAYKLTRLIHSFVCDLNELESEAKGRVYDRSNVPGPRAFKRGRKTGDSEIMVLVTGKRAQLAEMLAARNTDPVTAASYREISNRDLQTVNRARPDCHPCLFSKSMALRLVDTFHLQMHPVQAETDA